MKPGQYWEILISNLFILWVNANDAYDLKTRKSIMSLITTILGVTVHWQIRNQFYITAQSTYSELRVFFTVTIVNCYLQVVV